MFYKKVFLKIWQNSQENTQPGRSLFYNKVADLQTYSYTGVFLKILPILKNNFFSEQLLETTSTSFAKDNIFLALMTIFPHWTKRLPLEKLFPTVFLFI